MNQFVVTLIVILLPGIIATVISDKLTAHSKWTSFKYALYSLVLGSLTYTLLQIAVYIANIWQQWGAEEYVWSNLSVWNTAINGGKNIDATEVVLATFFSIPFAYLIALIINRKYINKLGKWLNVTQKYGDENLFSYYLSTDEVGWVYVRDIDNNLSYLGAVHIHSENDDIQELVLSEVKVYNYSDSELLYEVPTMYLAKPAGNFIIEAAQLDQERETNDD